MPEILRHVAARNSRMCEATGRASQLTIAITAVASAPVFLHTGILHAYRWFS